MFYGCAESRGRRGVIPIDELARKWVLHPGSSLVHWQISPAFAVVNTAEPTAIYIRIYFDIYGSRLGRCPRPSSFVPNQYTETLHYAIMKS